MLPGPLAAAALAALALLTACPERQVTGAPPLPRPALVSVGDLAHTLRLADHRVAIGPALNLPFVPAPGRLLRVDGQEVVAFDFPSVADRAAFTRTIGAASTRTIAAAGDAAGASAPDDGPGLAHMGGRAVYWAQTPHLWANGQLLVLALDAAPSLQALLGHVLGPQLTAPDARGVAQPPMGAALARRALADRLGRPEADVRLIAWEPLGDASGPVAPAYRVSLAHQGETWVVATDAEGARVQVEHGPRVLPVDYRQPAPTRCPR